MAVDKRALMVDLPALEHTVLGVTARPPGGGALSALAPEVARTGPGADLAAVDPEGDVRGPGVVMKRRFGTDFHAERQAEERRRLRQSVWKAVFQVAAAKPHQACPHALRSGS